MKNKADRQKIVFSKKRIRIVILFLCLSLLLLYFSVALDPKYKYVRQGLAFSGYVCIVLTLYNFGKLFTREIRLELYRRISKALFGVAEKLKAIVDKVKDKLGIKSAKFHRHRDEVRIIINDDRDLRKKKKTLTKKRFSQLEDDVQRIRYMYAKLLIWKQKKGENVYTYQTPEELKYKVAQGETETELFEIYTPVRYSEVPKITPEEVKKQYDYLTKSIKLK